MPAHELPLILVVDDDRHARAGVRRALGPSCTVIGAVDARAAERVLGLRVPDAVVLALALPDAGGDELLRRWRADPRLQGIPVVAVTSDGTADAAAAALGDGAFDVVVTPWKAAEFRARVATAVRFGSAHRRLVADNDRLRDAAMTDPLTGVLNRRGGEERLLELVEACVAEHGMLSIAAVDLDFFKAINDTHGHQVGDEALVATTRALSDALREGDVLYRAGGDEFVALLVDSDEAEAPAIAGRLRLAVAGAGAGLALSATVGCATWRPGDSPADVLHRADEAVFADRGMR